MQVVFGVLIWFSQRRLRDELFCHLFMSDPCICHVHVSKDSKSHRFGDFAVTTAPPVTSSFGNVLEQNVLRSHSALILKLP